MLKHGELHGSINAKNMDKVFYKLSSKHKSTVKYTNNGTPYFSANGYRVTLYNLQQTFRKIGRNGMI